MGRLIAFFVIVGLISLGACASLEQECQIRKEQAELAATLAGNQLRPGMTTTEVEALLGKPHESLIYRDEPGAPETWKYFIFPDCKKHLGITAPTTVLKFQDGQLVEWEVY